MIRKQKVSEYDLTPELKMLLSLLHQSDNQFLEEQFKSIDWSEFTNLAIHHRLYPVIYPKITKFSEWIPSYVLDILGKEYSRNSIQMLGLSAETIRISKLFGDNQIRSLVLKGPFLGLELYGDISLRTSKDIDILVPQNMLEKVKGLLNGLGYLMEDDEHDLKSNRKWNEHHLSFVHQQSNYQVEVHWKLITGTMSDPSFEDLWKNRRLSKISSDVMFLGESDLFSYLAIHGARHGWFRLRWLLDIHQLILKSENWELLEGCCRKYECFPIAGQSILLANKFFGTELPSKTSKFTTNKIAIKLSELALPFILNMINFTDLSKEMRLYYRSYLYSLHPNKQKLIYLLTQLLPNRRDMQTIKLPKSLSFLYFPLRPLLWFVRQIKAK